MFDFGFSELVVIGVVMLIVVGPERLPKVARTAGHLLGRLQRYVSDVKSDIQREMQLEELKKLQQQVQEQANEMESSVRAQVSDLEAGVGKTVDEVKAGLPAETSAGASIAANTGGTESVDAARTAAPQLELGLDPEGKQQPVPVNKT
ncbi:twin-arginine translocase subunit TatB [Azoarcus sp. L1K30]|uniref:Sec-independent protein translocase protein TatB n=1 Tax=Azoarcus sp. L1K30 TaxID=2820277 RepID=UPI001B821630|nr:Sec-independent protein translocase protein TatB [Azoarcus sp. L1K30]MBR0568333.1 twin-arginine translocase subunit TatB [Azoarcus sp. L1K30]